MSQRVMMEFYKGSVHVPRDLSRILQKITLGSHTTMGIETVHLVLLTPKNIYAKNNA